MSRKHSSAPRGVLISQADIPLVLAAILAGQKHWDHPRFRHRDRVLALTAQLAAAVETPKEGGDQS